MHDRQADELAVGDARRAPQTLPGGQEIIDEHVNDGMIGGRGVEPPGSRLRACLPSKWGWRGTSASIERHRYGGVRAITTPPVNTKTRAKVLLTRVGGCCSARTIYNLNGVFNYLHVGWWLRAHGLEPEARFSTRDEVFRHIAADIADDDVLYLEFGVRWGASLRRWSELLRNPRSELLRVRQLPGIAARLESRGARSG